ncbi:MAG: hypothetical protein JWR67_2209 [Mucilaginibacter sp.]|nr:hypothetical protein [Mucilaginibacter sp.]
MPDLFRHPTCEVNKGYLSSRILKQIQDDFIFVKLKIKVPYTGRPKDNYLTNEYFC